MQGSVSDYAKHRGVSQPAVSQAIKSGRLHDSLTRVGKRWKIDFALADAEWDRTTSLSYRPPPMPETFPPPPPPPSSAVPEDDDDMTYSKARTTTEIFKSKLAELEFKKKSGEVIDRVTANQTAFDIAKNTRERFFAAAPRLVAVALGAKSEPDAIVAVKAEIRIILTDTSDAIETAFD